jgi:hypothetical protein
MSTKTGAVDGWLWRNGKIDSMPEVVLDWFGRLVVEKAMYKMVSIAGDEGSITRCGNLSGCRLLRSFS